MLVQLIIVFSVHSGKAKADAADSKIEALIKEAAELVDESQPQNPNYCSTYKTHYVLKRRDDGTWRFCKGNVQTPS
ncbi:hypothetical protein Pint_16640 [Pistacia integerrima]|uniref:Uncharacterized protein n=1 Tax=Pistacia integerrima TaxID=434235 RepID=A0ACC0Z8C1_9ROSI|nr:hypothetical protein Pint_16640 [Pistacia integerrima]